MERDGRQGSSWDEAVACHLGPDPAPLLAALARMRASDLAAFTAGARRMAMRLESAGEGEAAAVWQALGALSTEEEHRRREVAAMRAAAEAEAAARRAREEPVAPPVVPLDTAGDERRPRQSRPQSRARKRSRR